MGKIMDYTNVLVGLGAALFGGVTTKIVERFLPSADKKIDAEAQLRDELWKELGSLKSRIIELERQSTEWREKYFELLEKYGRLELDYKFTMTMYEEMELTMFKMRQNIQIDILDKELIRNGKQKKAPTVEGQGSVC